jgi:hypothetical protein
MALKHLGKNGHESSNVWNIRKAVWATLRLHWLQPIHMPKLPSPHTTHNSCAEASMQWLGTRFDLHGFQGPLQVYEFENIKLICF